MGPGILLSPDRSERLDELLARAGRGKGIRLPGGGNETTAVVECLSVASGGFYNARVKWKLSSGWTNATDGTVLLGNLQGGSLSTGRRYMATAAGVDPDNVPIYFAEEGIGRQLYSVCPQWDACGLKIIGLTNWYLNTDGTLSAESDNCYGWYCTESGIVQRLLSAPPEDLILGPFATEADAEKACQVIIECPACSPTSTPLPRVLFLNLVDTTGDAVCITPTSVRFGASILSPGSYTVVHGQWPIRCYSYWPYCWEIASCSTVNTVRFDLNVTCDGDPESPIRVYFRAILAGTFDQYPYSPFTGLTFTEFTLELPCDAFAEPGSVELGTVSYVADPPDVHTASSVRLVLSW